MHRTQRLVPNLGESTQKSLKKSRIDLNDYENGEIVAAEALWSYDEARKS